MHRELWSQAITHRTRVERNEHTALSLEVDSRFIHSITLHPSCADAFDELRLSLLFKPRCEGIVVAMTRFNSLLHETRRETDLPTIDEIRRIFQEIWTKNSGLLFSNNSRRLVKRERSRSLVRSAESEDIARQRSANAKCNCVFSREMREINAIECE